MTPKEKAEYLLYKFRKAGVASIEDIEVHSAKQCAAICVEQIMEDLKNNKQDITRFGIKMNYWQQVLNHLTPQTIKN